MICGFQKGSYRKRRSLSRQRWGRSPSAARTRRLVIKGNELYVPGVLQDGGRAAPGEVVIYAGASEVRLKSGGTIEIRGRVEITGEAYVNGRKVVTE